MLAEQKPIRDIVPDETQIVVSHMQAPTVLDALHKLPFKVMPPLIIAALLIILSGSGLALYHYLATGSSTRLNSTNKQIPKLKNNNPVVSNNKSNLTTKTSGPTIAPSQNNSLSTTSSAPAPKTSSNLSNSSTTSQTNSNSSVAGDTSGSSGSTNTGGSGSSPPSSTMPDGVSGNWTLKFDDEFSGSSLDTTKWSTGWLAAGITPPVNSEELECYDPSQVSVSGGYLNLSVVAKQESCGGTARPYASGMINSYNKFDFTYGFIQASIYLPGNSSGTIYNWPAWWSDGQGLNWPTDGELDVVEGLGGQACFHFHSPSGAPGGCVSSNYTGWHTYGANWQPGSVTYYYDGTEVGQINSGITSVPQFLVLNLAVDNSNGGPISVPSTMKVDYVRVWQ